MNCGLHRISSNVERIVRPGLKPPRGACPGHVRLSAVSNPQSCREMLNHWSCPFVGHGFGPSSSDGKLNEEAFRYTSCPSTGRASLPSAYRPGILPVRRPNTPPLVVLAPAADSSRSHRLNPLGPRVFTVGSVHKWRHRLRCVSTVPALRRDFRAPTYEGFVHLVLSLHPDTCDPRCVIVSCWRPRPPGFLGLTQRRTHVS